MTEPNKPEALRLAELLELAPEDGVEPQTTEDAAAELRRLHTENTMLQQGYAAARLEIESLRGRSVPVSEADMVLAAMETGEWELQRLLPQTCFTSEANIRNAWSVKRSAAPYCTKDGLRIWTGATPLEALCNGAAALGVELPGCSGTAALPKTVVAILGEQAELRRLSDCCPELNLSNYGPDDVDELNGWAIEVSQCIDRAMRAAQPAGAQAAPELTETAVTAKNPAAPVSSFEDSRTQAVYEVLVNDNYPPAGSNEHWEGWKARLIVDALFPIEAPAAVAADSVLEDAGGANWQDISTAPKDGTRFVAVGNNYGLYSEMQHTCIAQWFRGCWIEASDWNETSELKYLTHWMPLLPLPGSAARKQGANHD